jgi:hypothetical protein
MIEPRAYACTCYKCRLKTLHTEVSPSPSPFPFPTGIPPTSLADTVHTRHSITVPGAGPKRGPVGPAGRPCRPVCQRHSLVDDDANGGGGVPQRPGPAVGPALGAVAGGRSPVQETPPGTAVPPGMQVVGPGQGTRAGSQRRGPEGPCTIEGCPPRAQWDGWVQAGSSGHGASLECLSDGPGRGTTGPATRSTCWCRHGRQGWKWRHA